MARLIVEEIVSADGRAQDADGGMDHVPASVDEGGIDVDQHARFADVDAIILGANTYRLFSGYWPDASTDDEPLADIINTRPKHVVSNSLTDAPWGAFTPARIERGDALASIRRIKHGYPGEVVLWGSLTLAAAAFAAGQVDILRLRIVPTLVGGGRGFTTAGLDIAQLELIGARTYSGGQVTVEYALKP